MATKLCTQTVYKGKNFGQYTEFKAAKTRQFPDIASIKVNNLAFDSDIPSNIDIVIWTE